METAAARLGLEDRQAKLTKVLVGEDALGVVIRAHIYIEHELTEFIRARLFPPDALDAITLDYSGRVRLALKLGLPPELKAALKFIGTLRNRFAHCLDAAIEKQDADNFENAVSSDAKAIIEQAYRGTHAKLNADKKAVPIKQREPTDRVVLQLVNLWAVVAVAAAKAKAVSG